MGTSKEMPKYKCHKEVWSLKIKNLEYDIKRGGVLIIPEEDGFGSILKDHPWKIKHNPEVGGYYVVYEDGYTSYSPAEAFEGWYSKIKTDDHRVGRKYRLQKLYPNVNGFKIGEEVMYHELEGDYYSISGGYFLDVKEVEDYPDYWTRIK